MNKKDKKFIEQKKKSSDHYNTISTKMIHHRWTVLIGPNGTGKSMSLKNIKHELKHNKDVSVFMYSNHQENPAPQAIPPFGDIDKDYLTALVSSEGESITIIFWKWLGKNIPYKNLINDTTPLWLLIDELDSGLSIDRIYEQLKALSSLVSKASMNRDIKVIISCNSYELLECIYELTDDNDIIWIPSKTHIKLPTYKQFKKLYIDYMKEISNDEDL